MCIQSQLIYNKIEKNEMEWNGTERNGTTKCDLFFFHSINNEIVWNWVNEVLLAFASVIDGAFFSLPTTLYHFLITLL